MGSKSSAAALPRSAPGTSGLLALERRHLRVGAVARLGLEQNVVVGVRVERRVEIDEVDAFARDMLA